MDLQGSADPFAALFAEELGLVLEVAEGSVDEVVQRFTAAGVSCSKIGQVRGWAPARLHLRAPLLCVVCSHAFPSCIGWQVHGWQRRQQRGRAWPVMTMLRCTRFRG